MARTYLTTYWLQEIMIAFSCSVSNAPSRLFWIKKRGKKKKYASNVFAIWGMAKLERDRDGLLCEIKKNDRPKEGWKNHQLHSFLNAALLQNSLNIHEEDNSGARVSETERRKAIYVPKGREEWIKKKKREELVILYAWGKCTLYTVYYVLLQAVNSM